jgi:uncharacterized membrane protein
MNGNDFLCVLRWWMMFFVIGLAFLPLAKSLFSSFLDKGYAFSKILGTIIVSYLVFILGVAKVAPFTPLTIYVIFSICILVVVVSAIRKRSWIFDLHTVKLFLLEEILFFICLLVWSYIRGFNPDINGLEKFMDFGFVNSILRSEFFPPKDMWFTPLPINYYYFGHLFTAILTKASGLPSIITFNLMIATLFALSFIESFSIGINLLANHKIHLKKSIIRIIFGGMLIASLVTLSGNLHIIYSFFKPYEVDKPVPFWNLQFSFLNPCYSVLSYEQKNNQGKTETVNCSQLDQKKLLSFPNSYWYPNATRFIYHTIHEFPIYSWVVSDLHGHVLDIPVVLLTIGVLFSLLLKSDIYFRRTEDGIQKTPIESGKTDSKSQKSDTILSSVLSAIRHPSSVFSPLIWYLFLIGFLLAVMYMTNAWDGLTYLMLTTFILLYILWRKNSLFIVRQRRINLWLSLFVYLFIILSSYLIFALPFSLNFDPSKIVAGIGVVSPPSFLLEKKADPSTGSFGFDNRNLIIKLIIPDHCQSLMSASDSKKVTTQYASRKIGPFLFEPDHCLRSLWWQLFILYGFFYFFVAIFIFVCLKYSRQINPKHEIRSTKQIQNTNDINSKRFENSNFENYNLLRISNFEFRISISDIFVIILIIVSTILIIIPEFFYMKDIYPDHYRANTMFKLVFQSFIMLSISSGYIIIRTISKANYIILTFEKRLLYIIYFILTASLLSLVFIYPYFAITSYYNNLNNYRGFDGLIYIKNNNPDDYEAIKWLNSNIVGQPVVLEAQGDSYTDYERISANTGLPTVLGWYVHEWLWRGVDAPTTRSTDVKTLYESPDLTNTIDLINKYHVSYVLIGKKEKEKYPNINEDKFKQLGTLVFQKGSITIYKLK